jgi:hypothetical protein
MKIVKQLANKIKSIATGVSTFIPTQLSFWYGGQYVTTQTMNVFSKDIYEKLALLATNTNNFPTVILCDGGISKFIVTDDKKFIDLPAFACAFQLVDGQGDNLPYKPYTIGYADAQRVLISTGTLTQKLYINAYISITNVDTNPTNVPTPIKISQTVVKSPDKNLCLLCVVNTDGSLDFSKTNFLVNSAVTTTGNTGNTELINPQNKINAITPDSLSLYKNLGALARYDQRIIDNGGYAEGRVIHENESGYWVMYQSLINNNINPKPTLASCVGWDVIYYYATSPNGTTVYGIKDLEVVHAQGTSATFVSYTDATKNLVIGKLYDFNPQLKMEYGGQRSITLTSINYYNFPTGSNRIFISIVGQGYNILNIQSLQVDYANVSDIQDTGSLAIRQVDATKLEVWTNKAPVNATAYLSITIKAQLA